jgi:hypothetical protein
MAMGRQQKIDRRSVLVHGAGEVAPFAPDFHRGLVETY